MKRIEKLLQSNGVLHRSIIGMDTEIGLGSRFFITLSL